MPFVCTVCTVFVADVHRNHVHSVDVLCAHHLRRVLRLRRGSVHYDSDGGRCERGQRRQLHHGRLLGHNVLGQLLQRLLRALLEPERQDLPVHQGEAQ